MIRICTKRDAVCPHGMRCPYADGYDCTEPDAARPPPTGEKVEADKEALIDFLVNYGGRCRDCADENGFCPRTGVGCGQRKQAAIFFVAALEYGSKHGFAGGYTLYSAETVAALEAERDEARARLKAARATIVAGQGAHDDVVNLVAEWKVRATIAESALAALTGGKDAS